MQLPQNIQSLETPCLLVYPEVVRQNIKTALAMVNNHGQRLRPHIKTHKTREVIYMCLEAGITDFKAATLSELELLGACGVRDALLAYQPTGAKIIRYTQLVKKYPETRFSCLVDNVSSAKELSKTSINNGLVTEVFIDVNVGMNRTGIVPENVVELAKEITQLSGIKFRGLHAYDGHLHMGDYHIREEMANVVYRQIRDLQTELLSEGIPCEIPIMGGSPTFPIYASKEDVICSPGTFVFWDEGYLKSFPEQAFKPAIYILGTVSSAPMPQRFCIDIGHKAVSAENELSRRLVFPDYPQIKFVGQSEEHLVVAFDGDLDVTIGDAVLAIPIHVCPTVALHDKLFLVEGGHVTGVCWEVVARNRS